MCNLYFLWMEYHIFYYNISATSVHFHSRKPLRCLKVHIFGLRSAGLTLIHIAPAVLWSSHRLATREVMGSPNHWSPTVLVSVWLPEPARDRGWKQKTLNDDFYHTTSHSAAIFGVQAVLPYLVLPLNLWIGLYPTTRSSGVWNFGEVLVTYRSRNAMFRYRTSEVPVPNQKLR